MKIVVATATVAVLALGSTAFAQTAAFKCPAKGTTFITRGDGVDTTAVSTGQDGDACTSERVSNGKTVVLREHWGLIGSVDAAGESYVRGLDLKSLWPLKIGNRISQKVNSVGYDGKPYTTTVTIIVAAYEKVTVPAGTFDAFRIEERKAEDSAPRTRWWAPAVATPVKQTFPDWQDRSKLKVYELAAIESRSSGRLAYTTGLAPPSTLIATPVMNEPASEQRKQAMRANSSALPMRPIGMRPLAMPSRNSW